MLSEFPVSIPFWENLTRRDGWQTHPQKADCYRSLIIHCTTGLLDQQVSDAVGERDCRVIGKHAGSGSSLVTAQIPGYDIKEATRDLLKTSAPVQAFLEDLAADMDSNYYHQINRRTLYESVGHLSENFANLTGAVTAQRSLSERMLPYGGSAHDLGDSAPVKFRPVHFALIVEEVEVLTVITNRRGYKTFPPSDQVPRQNSWRDANTNIFKVRQSIGELVILEAVEIGDGSHSQLTEREILTLDVRESSGVYRTHPREIEATQSTYSLAHRAFGLRQRNVRGNGSHRPDSGVRSRS